MRYTNKKHVIARKNDEAIYGFAKKKIASPSYLGFAMTEIFDCSFVRNIVLMMFSLQLCFLQHPVSAQTNAAPTVNINLTLTPPYSPYYADYSGIDAAKVLLILQNTGADAKQVKLAGTLTGDNGIKVWTKSTYIPRSQITLNPFEVKQLNGLALKDVFDVNSLNVLGVNKSELVYSSRIPEGNYTLCVQALDYTTGAPLSAEGLGCTVITISYPEAPVLINPVTDSHVTATQPQSVIFNWINQGIVPAGTQYEFQLMEMPPFTKMNGRTPLNANQVLKSASFPLVSKTLSSTSYVLSPSDPPLKVGAQYTWRVHAVDPSGKVLFKNDGISEANVFTYVAMPLTLGAPTINTPSQNTEFLQTRNNFQVLIQPTIDIAWSESTAPNTDIGYSVKVVKVNPNDDVATLLATNAQLVVQAKVAANAFKIKPVSGLITNALSMQKPTQIEEIPSTKVELEPDATYAIQVTASGTDAYGSAINFSNLGGSNIVLFKYKAAPALPPVEDNTSTIAGRLVYRYKNDNEQPTYRPLNFPPKQVFKRVGSFMSYVPNDEPYPDVVANNMFANNTSTRPLKNAKIKLVYMRFESSVKDPASYKDLKPYDAENAPSQTIYAPQYEKNEKPDIVVGTGVTDENGNFSITFLNDMKIGLLEEIETTSFYRKEFGAICITVDEPEYCSSDMLIFPKKGKTIYLPDEVIFPRSFQLEMTVKTDKTTDQALVSSAPVAGYPVQLSVIKNNYPIKPSYPIESNIEAYKEMYVQLLGQKATVLDLGKTDANGKIIFKNLLLADDKYVQALEQKFEGNFAYETKTFNFIRDKFSANPFFNANYKLSRRNSALQNPTFKRDLIITPKKPQIYLRAMTLQNGIPVPIENATVTITEYANSKAWFPTTKTYQTDKNGYFELRDLEITTEQQGDLKKVVGPVRTITITKDGYTKLTVATKQLLSFGERFPAQVEQFMSGGGTVAGHVVNQAGYPVICNVRIADGPYVKTDDKGFFSISNTASGMVTQIEVVPCVDNYFPELWHANVASGTKTLVSNIGVKDGRIVVKEKLHRVQLKIVDENNAPILQSKTTIGTNMTLVYQSNKDGSLKEIGLASPDNEFRIRTVADGFVTYDDYHMIPIGKTAKTITIKMIRAKTIVGYVLDSKTKKPIAGARVYTISGTNDDGQVQNETKTDANGYYVLSGAINQSMFFDYSSGINMQKPIEVYAVKGGDNAYLRQSQTVIFGYGQGSQTISRADFQLTSLGIKSEIWGLPIEINAAEDVPSTGHVKISGAFVNIPANTSFKTTIDNAQLPFKDLVLTLGKWFELTPTTNEIVLQKNTLKVTAFDKFSCEMLGSDQFYQYPLLKITKNSKDLGVLNGFVTSELSSFNFSYNYNGKFLFDNGGVRIPGKPLISSIDVLGAVNSFVPKAQYNLKALYNVSNFKVHNFNASMINGSFVNKDKFAINAAVNLDIPLLSTKSLPVGTVNVMQNDISWNDYVGDIDMPLEKWAVRGKGLKYELNKGGFKIVDGTLQTDLPNVPLKDMILMPNSIDLGSNNLTGNEVLTLGNVTQLKLVGDAKLTLNYDAAAPFDQKPHYRINLSKSIPQVGSNTVSLSTNNLPTSLGSMQLTGIYGTGQTNTTSGTNPKGVAYISDIPGIAPSDKIDIELFTAYSDGQHKTVNVAPAVHRFFDVISQTITGIEVGKDYFTLIGNTNLEIPGANNNVTGRFRYYKDAAGKVQQTTEKLQTDIEMPGKVKFNGTSFKLSQGVFSATGDVLIYKNTLADAILIHGTVTKTASETKMDIHAKEMIKMGTTGRAMKILYGGNRVNGNNWDLVSFTATPDGFVIGGKDILEEENNEIDFIVNGAVSNNPKSDKTIQLQGIPSPFGAFDISFDFEKRALMGALSIAGASVPLGPVTVHDGKIDMQIDGNGFILCGAITNASLTPLPILDGFKSGVAMGFYNGPLPSYMTKNLLNVTLYNQLPGLEDGLKGLYVNVMKSLSKSDLPSLPGPSLDDIPGLGAFVPTFDFSAGIDLRTSINLNKGLAVTIGGKAEAYASCLYKLKLCDIGLSGNAEGEFGFEYIKPDLTGFLRFGIGANLIYCVGSKGVGMSLLLEKKPSGFKFTASPK